MAVPQHFSIVVLDVEASGELAGPEKKQVREDLYAIMREALSRSEIAEESVRSEDRGDGIFLLIAAGVSKRLLLDPLIGLIDESLRMRRVGEPRLRLRLVVHDGEVTLDDNGSSGGALDEAFAMLDAAEVKEALAQARSGRLALVVPDDLYRAIVVGYPAPDPNAFRMRRLETKRGRIRTWVTVTGAREQPGSGRREPEKTRHVVGTPVQQIHQGNNVRVKKNSGFVGTNESGTVNFSAPPPERDV